MLLLHGIPGSALDWEDVAGQLRQTHRVLVPDLLGFGASARPTAVDVLWAHGQATAVGEALDAVGVTNVAVVGHDFGGPVTLALLQQQRERVTHIGLLATNAFPDTPVPFPLSTVTWPVIGGLASRALFAGPSLRAMVRAGMCSTAARGDRTEIIGDRGQRRAVRLIFSHALRHLSSLYAPMADTLGSLDVPTLVAWGDRDPFLSVEQGRRTAAAIPGARLVVYEKAGHFLPRERPNELAEDIRTLVDCDAESRRAA